MMGKPSLTLARGILSSAVSHMVTKNRGHGRARDTERKPGPDEVASGHVCGGVTPEICQ